MRSLKQIVFIAAAFLACFAGQANAERVELTDGAVFHGKLSGIKSGGHFFDIPASDVLEVMFEGDMNVVKFRSGSAIKGKILNYENETYTIVIASTQLKSIRMDEIQGPQSSPRLPATTVNNPEADVAPKDVYGKPLLRLHGSNTIGAELAPALAEAFLRRLGAESTEVKRDRPVEMRVLGYFPGKSKVESIEIHAHGSSTSFKDMNADKCDIGMASRKIKKEEVATLSRKGKMDSFESEHVLGIDGIAVIVNKKNPVFKLDKKEIQKIFLGEIRDWSHFGKTNGSIQVYARDENSGTWDTFKNVVLEKNPLVESAKRYEDSKKLSDLVAADENGIGFIGLPYILDAKAIAVSDGGNPIHPASFSIATEDYPLSRRLYLYTPSPLDEGSLSRRFVEFALSETGQEIVVDKGFIGLNIDAVKPRLIGDFTPDYKRAVEGMKRLSTNFRFKTNSHELDNRGVRDLERVRKFLADNNYDGDRIYLMGFTDNDGAESYNKQLSIRRASGVLRDLNKKRIGIPPDNAMGFGESNPIASNESPLGKERNRRVEVWVK